MVEITFIYTSYCFSWMMNNKIYIYLLFCAKNQLQWVEELVSQFVHLHVIQSVLCERVKIAVIFEHGRQKVACIDAAFAVFELVSTLVRMDFIWLSAFGQFVCGALVFQYVHEMRDLRRLFHAIGVVIEYLTQ